MRCIGESLECMEHVKTKLVRLTDVRKAMKETTGTPSYCIKQLYAVAETCSELRAVLPAKKDGLALVKSICEWGNVGGKRLWKGVVKGCPTQKEVTIKCSVDMCLRYFVKLAKGEFSKGRN